MGKPTSRSTTKKAKDKTIQSYSLAFDYLDQLIAQQTAALYAVYKIQPASGKAKVNKKITKRLQPVE